MKKYLLIIFAAAAAIIASCTKADQEVLDKISSLDKRVTELEGIVSRLNTDVTTLQNLVVAAVKGTYITSVTETDTGYVLTMSDGKVLTVNNGVDGEDGDTPVIGVAKDSDGVYYWTVDGEWLLDGGQKVSAQGITPQFRMNGNFLQVSYDKGVTWKDLCEISGGVTPAIKKVEQDDNYVYFTLKDDTVIKIAKTGASMSLTLTPADTLKIDAGASAQVSYSVEGASGDVKVSVVTSGEWKAKASAQTGTTGVIDVTAPAVWADAELLVFAYSKNAVACASLVCVKPDSPGQTHKVQVQLGSVKTSLSQVGGGSSYAGTVNMNGKGEFTIFVDDVEYGFLAKSGNGGVGTLENANAAIPVSKVATAGSNRTYNLTKSVGLLAKKSASGCNLWYNLSAASDVKVTVTVADEKIVYRLDVANTDAKLIWGEDFSLCSLGSDYIAPYMGYNIPDGLTPATYDGLTPSTLAVTDIANGATQFDYPTKVKLAVAADEYMANRDLQDWTLSYVYEHPVSMSIGAYKAAGYCITPAVGGSYSGNAVLKFDVSRFSDSQGDIKVSIIGGGSFTSGTSTLDGKQGSQTYSSFTEGNTQFSFAQGEWCPLPETKDAVDKPISHFEMQLSGVTPATAIRFDVVLGESQTKNAPRFHLFGIGVYKN